MKDDDLTTEEWLAPKDIQRILRCAQGTALRIAHAIPETVRDRKIVRTPKSAFKRYLAAKARERRETEQLRRETLGRL